MDLKYKTHFFISGEKHVTHKFTTYLDVSQYVD